MIYILIYFIGLIITALLLKIFDKFEEGRMTFDEWGVYEYTKEIHRVDMNACIVLWPLYWCVLLFMIPIIISDWIISYGR